MREAAWDGLTSLVGARSTRFLAEVHRRRNAPIDADGWRAAFSTAARRLGEGSLDDLEAKRLRALGVDWSLTASQLGRAVMLLELEGRVAHELFLVLLKGCWRTSDTAERQAILRALPLLSEPRPLVDLAIEGCRSNLAPVFAAVACDNPFPRDHFPDCAFHQMALKTIFLGLPLSTVRGWEARRGHELVHMARDYISELTAAGRPIPVDLSLLGANP